MSKKLTKFELNEWKKYRRPSTSFHKCKVNEFIIFANNTYAHELGKFKIAFDLMKEGHKILTECEEISSGERCDLVDITDGERYEVESTIVRAQRFIGRPTNIVAVGWDLESDKWKRLLEKQQTTKVG